MKAAQAKLQIFTGFNITVIRTSSDVRKIIVPLIWPVTDSRQLDANENLVIRKHGIGCFLTNSH